MKTISLPRSPFFCADDGRYLPTLTDLIVEASAMLQRREIEEQLFTLRLKRKCFVALDEAAPEALEVRTKSSLKIFPGGSVGNGFQIQPDSPSALPLSRPGPTTAGDETVKISSRRAASVFDSPNHYPKGRW